MANVSVVEDGTKTTVIGTGELTLSNAQEFAEQLKQASCVADVLVVDLRSAQFIDSAVVLYLASAAKALIDRGRLLQVLVEENGYPLRVLKIVGILSLMETVAVSRDVLADDIQE